MITQAYLQSILNYDPETGCFTWARRQKGIVYGSEAGAPSGKGYRYRFIKIDRRPYSAHRLAWLYVHGRWPIDQIDHINGDGLDNRLANLREATAGQNQQNKPANRNNKIGLKGASPAGNRWKAQIKAGGVWRHLGYFATPEEAHGAYCRAAHELHGEFARTD